MITLTVNGQTHEIDAEPDTPLLWVLRDFLGHNGAKYGCGIACCGACAVHVDGNSIRSCIVPASAAEGSDIRTIEDLDNHPVQQAWIEHQVPQCGYCQSGMIMAAKGLLDRNPEPSDADIDAAITWGLTSAMFGEILIDSGATRQKNFNEYELVRISHIPTIETVILPPADTPGSGGECGAPPAV